MIEQHSGNSTGRKHLLLYHGYSFLTHVTIIVKIFQNRSPICISPYYEYWIPVSILLNGQERTLPYPVFFHFIFSVMIFTLNEKFEEYNICIFLVISWCFVEFKKNPEFYIFTHTFCRHNIYRIPLLIVILVSLFVYHLVHFCLMIKRLRFTSINMTERKLNSKNSF